MSKKLKGDNILTEDSQRDFDAEIQEMTDKTVKQIDAATEAKEKEIMTV